MPRSDRIQVRGIDAPELRPKASPVSVRPAATPVDTFVRPQNHFDPYAGAKLDALSRALAPFSETLGRIAESRWEQKKVQDTEDGVLWAQEQAAAKRAIDAGAVPAGASPFFRQGVLRQAGASAAARFESALNIHVGTNPGLQTSLKEEDFEAAVASFREEWLAGEAGNLRGNRDFQLGFNTRAQAVVDRERVRFGNQVIQRYEHIASEAHFADTRVLLKDSLGRLSEEETVTAFGEYVGRLRNSGRDPGSLARVTAQAGASLAMELGGDQGRALARVLGKLTVDGKSLGDYDPKVAALVADLPTEIAKREYAAAQTEENMAGVRLRTTRRARLGEAMARWQTDRNASVDDIILAANHDGDPTIAEELKQARAALTNVREWQDDPDVEQRLATAIIQGRASERQVTRALAEKQITPSTAFRLVGAIQSRQDRLMSLADRERREAREGAMLSLAADEAFKDLLRHPAYTTAVGNFKSRLSQSGLYQKDVLGDQKADYAESLLADAWLTYRAGVGREASGTEALKFLNDQVDAITQGVTQVFEAGGERPVTEFNPRTARVYSPLGEARPGNPAVTAADLSSLTTNTPTSAAVAAMVRAGLDPKKVEDRRTFILAWDARRRGRTH